jgi:hypothetical protein
MGSVDFGRIGASCVQKDVGIPSLKDPLKGTNFAICSPPSSRHDNLTALTAVNPAQGYAESGIGILPMGHWLEANATIRVILPAPGRRPAFRGPTASLEDE